MDTFEFLSREEWGAREPRSVRRVLPHQFAAIEFHHSATGVSPAAAAARSFQRFHMDTKGWQDLFYNWLVHPDGTIVEGRSWVTSPRPENYMTVNFIGNYETMQLTEAQKHSARVMVAECHRRMPQLKDRAVRWHNQRAATACPGVNLVAFIRESNLHGWDVPEPEAVTQAVTDEELNDLAASAFSLHYKADRLAAQAEDNLDLVRRFRKEHDNG